MTADSEKDLQALRALGRVCAETLRTSDRAIAAQFEHTIVVTNNEPIILTLCR